MIQRLVNLLVLVCWFALWSTSSIAQDDVAGVFSQERTVRGDQQKRYFLIGAGGDQKAPEGGWGLVVVLPGGDGSAGFQPFVKRIWANALPDGYLVAQPVAAEWTENQQIVWPTASDRRPDFTLVQ